MDTKIYYKNYLQETISKEDKGQTTLNKLVLTYNPKTVYEKDVTISIIEKKK